MGGVVAGGGQGLAVEGISRARAKGSRQRGAFRRQDSQRERHRRIAAVGSDQVGGVVAGGGQGLAVEGISRAGANGGRKGRAFCRQNDQRERHRGVAAVGSGQVRSVVARSGQGLAVEGISRARTNGGRKGRAFCRQNDQHKRHGRVASIGSDQMGGVVTGSGQDLAIEWINRARANGSGQCGAFCRQNSQRERHGRVTAVGSDQVRSVGTSSRQGLAVERIG